MILKMMDYFQYIVLWYIYILMNISLVSWIYIITITLIKEDLYPTNFREIHLKTQNASFIEDWILNEWYQWCRSAVSFEKQQMIKFWKTKHCFSYGRVLMWCKRHHHYEVYRIMRLINTRFLRSATRSKIKDMSRVWGIFCSPLNNGWFYIIEIFSLNMFVVLQLLAWKQ